MNESWSSWFALLAEDLSLRIAVTLLHFLWQGCAIGVLVFLSNRMLRGASASSRYALHTAALLLLPACVIMTFAVAELPDGWRSAATGDAVAGALNVETATSDHEVDATGNQGFPSTSEIPTTIGKLAAMDEPAYAGGIPLQPAPESQSPQETFPKTQPLLAKLAPAMVLLYFLGVGLFLLRLVLAMWGGHRLRSVSGAIGESELLQVVAFQTRQVGLRMVPVVHYCERVSVPVVVGVLRPVILLPASLMTGLAPDQFAAIITHELAHIRRHDLLMNLLQQVVESMLFFHPAVWYISHRMSAEREICCDDLVVSSGCQPMDYADALLRTAELCSPALSVNAHALAASGDHPSQLESRIWRLIHMNQDSRFGMTPTGTLTIVLLALTVMGMPAIVHNLAQAGQPGRTPSPQAEDVTNQENSQPVDDKPQEEARTRFRLPDHWIVKDVRFVDDDRQLVTVSVQGGVDVRRWDLASRKLISEIKLAADEHGRSFRQDTLQLSGDGSRVLAATDNYVGLWDAETGDLLKRLPIPKQEWAYDCVRCLDSSADGSLIFAGLGTSYSRMTQVYDGYGIVWDAASGEVISRSTHKHGYYFGDVALSTDGKNYATCSEHGAAVCIWETSSGKLLREFSGEIASWKSPNPGLIKNNLVNAIAFTPDDQTLAVSGTFGFKLFDVASGDLLRTIDAPYRYYSGHTRLAFSPDGKQIARSGASGSEKGYRVLICSTETGESLFELQSSANAGAFSNDGKTFAAAESNFYEAVSVWPLVGTKKQSIAKPVPYARENRVEENTHHRGRKAQEFVDSWKPLWGQPQHGIEYGVAFTVPGNRFHLGQRVLMAAFVRNSSSHPRHVALRPDMFGNAPRITGAGGASIQLETRPLLGKPSHYRDTLQPGECFGPLYLNLGLGANPRPGQQYWDPFWKSPSTGVYKLAHEIDFHVAPLSVDRNSNLNSAGWTASEATSGAIEFEVTEE